METLKTLDQKLCERYAKGEINLIEVAKSFHKHGWTPFVDLSYARRQVLKYIAETKK